MLVDTGYEEDWDLFIEEIKKANVKFSEISHIILTHHHDDPCSLLANILKENSPIRVAMSYRCKDLISKDENDITHGGGLLINGLPFSSAKSNGMFL